MTTLAEAAGANPEIQEILSSSSPHTEAAERINALNGLRTTEASVRRWRSSRDWAPAQQEAVVRVTQAPEVAASLDDQGLQLYDALKPRGLPEDPVTLLGALLEPYAGPGQPDLRVVRKTDADGVTTVTVTAVRDDVAEAAAAIMADRIVKRENHRRLIYRAGSRDTVWVRLDPRAQAPLFPPGTPLRRYRRYAGALVRKLKVAGWTLSNQEGYTLVFIAPENVLQDFIAPENVLQDEEPVSREIRLMLTGL